MKRFTSHIQTYIVRGLLASIPLILCYYVLKFFYVFVDRQVSDVINNFIGCRIPGLGFLLVIVFLYLIGLLASQMIGKRFFSLLESIIGRIPLIKTTYQVGKQLTVIFSDSEQQVFKKAVLVDFLKPGVWALGFITGTMEDNQNPENRLIKVFIPTVPNPTSGLLMIVNESETMDPRWSIDEAIRIVISAGIISPERIR